MNISSRIKEERKRLGLSQADFGALGGAGKTTVIAWERGDATPNAAFLALAATAGADVRYIITGYRDGPAPLVLTADERELLTLFRAAPLAGKAAAIGALQGVAAASAPKVVIHGKVGNQIETNNGKITVNMGDKE